MTSVLSTSSVVRQCGGDMRNSEPRNEDSPLQSADFSKGASSHGTEVNRPSEGGAGRQHNRTPTSRRRSWTPTSPHTGNPVGQRPGFRSENSNTLRRKYKGTSSCLSIWQQILLRCVTKTANNQGKTDRELQNLRPFSS